MPEIEDISKVKLPDIFGKSSTEKVSKPISLDSVELPELFKKSIDIGIKGSIADRHNNPGNLMFANQQGAVKGEPKKGGGYWSKFETPEQGFEALVTYIDKKKQGKTQTGLSGESTLKEFMSVYAPPFENDTESYYTNLAKNLGIPSNTKIKNINTRDLAKEIAKYESGTTVNFDKPGTKFELWDQLPSVWDDGKYIASRATAPKTYENIPKENIKELDIPDKKRFTQMFVHEPSSTIVDKNNEVLTFDKDFKIVTGKTQHEAGLNAEEAVRHIFKQATVNNSWTDRAEFQIRSLANSMVGSAHTFLSQLAKNQKMSGVAGLPMPPDFSKKTPEELAQPSYTEPVNMNQAFQEWQTLKQNNQVWLDAYDPSTPEDMAAFVAGIFVDLPVFGAWGKAGNATIKAGQAYTKSLIKWGVPEATANKFLAGGLNRISSAMVRSGVNVGTSLGGYSAMMDITNQLASGKTIAEIDYEQAVKTGGKSFLIGNVIGPIGLGSSMLSKVVSDKLYKPIAAVTGLLDDGIAPSAKVIPEKLASSNFAQRWLVDKGIAATAIGAEAGIFTMAEESEEPKEFSDFLKLYSEFVILRATGGVKGFFGDPANKIRSEFDIAKNLKESNITPEELRSAGVPDVNELAYKMTDGEYLNKLLNDKNIPATLRTKVIASMHPDIQFNLPDLTKSADEVTISENKKNGKWTVSTVDRKGNKIEVKDFSTPEQADEIAKGANDKIKISKAYNAYEKGLPVNEQSKIDEKLESLGYEKGNEWKSFKNDPSLLKHPSQRVEEGERQKISSALDFINSTKEQYDKKQEQLRIKAQKEAEKKKEEGIPIVPEPKVEVPKESVPKPSPKVEPTPEPVNLPKNGEVVTLEQLTNLAREKGIINKDSEDYYSRMPEKLIEQLEPNSVVLERSGLSQKDKSELAFAANSVRSGTPLKLESYEKQKEKGNEVLNVPPEKAGEEISPAKTDIEKRRQEELKKEIPGYEWELNNRPEVAKKYDKVLEQWIDVADYTIEGRKKGMYNKGENQGYVESRDDYIELKRKYLEINAKYDALLKESPAKAEAARLKEEAKAKLDKGFSDLMNAIGGKKEIVGEEHKRAVDAIRLIADGLVDYAKSKGILLKDAIIEKWKEYFPDIKIDESLIDEALGGIQNAEGIGKVTAETGKTQGTEGETGGRIRVRNDAQDRLEAREGKRVTLSQEISNAVTERNAKLKVEDFMKKKENEINGMIETETKKLMKIVKDLEEGGQVVEIDNHRYIVKNLPDGKVRVLDPWTRNRKDQPTVVTNIALKKKILSEIDKNRGKEVETIIETLYDGLVAYREKLLTAAEKSAREFANKYITDRNKKLPEAPTKFSTEEPTGVTEPFKPEKGTREKLPSETGEKITMTERALKNLVITREQKAAYDAERDTDKKYSILSDAILTNLKEAKDNKNITAGQYKSVIRRLGNARNEKDRQAALEYVDKIVEGSEYKGQVKKAKGHINKIDDLKSKIGQYNQNVIDFFDNLDINQLSLEELYQFNDRAERIFKSTKVPFLKAAADIMEQFSDRIKEETKAEDIRDFATLKDYVDEIYESIGEKIESSKDFKAIQRKVTVARKLVDKLIEQDKLSEDELTQITNLFGDIYNKVKEPGGEIQAEMNKLVDAYIEEISNMKNQFSTEIEEFLSTLDPEMRERLQVILSANKEDLKNLGIGDIEAYDEFIFNLKEGYVTPYFGELKRQILDNRDAKEFISGATYNIGKSKRFGQLAKQNWVNRKLSLSQKVFHTNPFDVVFRNSWAKLKESERKDRKETSNLERTVMATKYHRLDLLFGNPSRKETLGITATKLDKMINEAHGIEEDYNVRLEKIYEPIEKKFKDAYEYKNFLRNMAFFFIERSWQSSPKFVDGVVTKNNASLNDYNFRIHPDETIIKATGNSKFRKQQDSWEKFRKEVKDNNLTKIMKDQEGKDVEVIDTEKLEAYLRKDKTANDFIDSMDQWFKDMAGMNTAASFENGIGAGQLKNYFPFFTAQVGKGRNPEEITLDRFQNYHAAMKAGSTFERARILQLVNLDIKDVAQKYVRSVTRNYFVLPQLHVAVGALNKGFKMAGDKLLQESANNKQTVENLNMLNKALIKDLQQRIDRYYKAGKFAVTPGSRIFEKGITSSKKSVLALTARIFPEFASNTLRATISMAGIPMKELMKFEKFKEQYKGFIDDVVGSKYISRYGGDVDVRRSEGSIFGEKGANWIITYSDTQVGRRLFTAQFERAFNEFAGKEFDVERYTTDPQYRIDNQIEVDRASHAALRKVEELFNDKSPLTTPTLTTFFGGMKRAESQNVWTHLFDYLQSYNRNESEQLIDSVRRMQYNKRGSSEYNQGMRDIAAIIASNALYNTLRPLVMVAAQYAIAGFKKDEMTPYNQKLIDDIATGKYFMQKFMSSNIGLSFGGSSNAYKTIASVPLYMIDQSELLTSDQKDEMFKAIERDYYVKRMPDWGTPESVFEAVPVIPSNVTKDAAMWIEDLASAFDAIVKFSPDRKTAAELISVINTALMYARPNPISPAIHKQIKNLKYSLEKQEKAIKSGEDATTPYEMKLEQRNRREEERPKSIRQQRREIRQEQRERSKEMNEK